MQVNERDTENLKKLPSWVKCVWCGQGPKENDWLGELFRHSSALAHQSCAAKRGKVFGMNAGTIQEINNVIKEA